MTELEIPPYEPLDEQSLRSSLKACLPREKVRAGWQTNTKLGTCWIADYASAVDLAGR
jgi:hypothetical protein